MKRNDNAILALANLPIEESTKRFIIEYCIDHDHRRSSIMAGIDPAWGVQLLKTPQVIEGIRIASAALYKASELNAGTIQEEMFKVFNIAMQIGKIATAAKLLDSIAKLQTVDAFAANKLEVIVDVNMVEELRKGRERMNALKAEVATDNIIEGLQSDALKSDFY